MSLTETTSAAHADMARCQKVLAHAWMVRTFIKHSSEVEEFPELMGIVRGVFDLSRALETRVDDPAGYFKVLHKKLDGLKNASVQFAIDAPLASGHTNFQQAVISIAACVDELDAILARNYTPPKPPRSARPTAAGSEGSAIEPASGPGSIATGQPEESDFVVDVDIQEEPVE
jgi:hypothetical protein